MTSLIFINATRFFKDLLESWCYNFLKPFFLFLVEHYNIVSRCFVSIHRAIPQCSNEIKQRLFFLQGLSRITSEIPSKLFFEEGSPKVSAPSPISLRPKISALRPYFPGGGLNGFPPAPGDHEEHQTPGPHTLQLGLPGSTFSHRCEGRTISSSEISTAVFSLRCTSTPFLLEIQLRRLPQMPSVSEHVRLDISAGLLAASTPP